MQKQKRINISIPIDLYKQIKHFKNSYPIKINVSDICNKAILKELKYINNNIDKLMELRELILQSDIILNDLNLKK